MSCIFEVDNPINPNYLTSTGWTKGYGEFYILRLKVSPLDGSFDFYPKFVWMSSANREEGHIVVAAPVDVLPPSKRVPYKNIETVSDLMAVVHGFIKEWIGDKPHISTVII